MIPLSILEWLARHMSHGGSGVFRHKTKSIVFNKGIIDKVFGFPSTGTIPFALHSDDPEIVREVEGIRKMYLKGNNIPIKHLEGILRSSDNEIVFIRSFFLYFVTTILCPCTYNFVNAKYLFSLRDSDIPNVRNLDFGNLCLTHLFSEIDSWAVKHPKNSGDANKSYYIGGCLPILGVRIHFLALFFYLLFQYTLLHVVI
jgi:hypothetical protein